MVHTISGKEVINVDGRYTPFLVVAMAHCGYTELYCAPGCVIKTDDAAPSALLTLVMMSTLRTKPVTLNHAQLAPPICHLHIRRYVLVLTCIFICLCQVDALKKVSPPNFRMFFSREVSTCPVYHRLFLL